MFDSGLMKTYYYVEMDGIYSMIVKREITARLYDEFVGQAYCYKTFSEAKKFLVESHASMVYEWREALARVKGLKKNGVEAPF